MIAVAFGSTFKKTFKKKIKNNRKLEEKFWEKVHIFIENPFENSLRTHKLSGQLSELWSFAVDYDVRIIFYFEEPEKAVFIDIGSHDEVY